jgi:plasmid maintenance system antidote protein VapI/DNA-binding XRE family transcriptional regulator
VPGHNPPPARACTGCGHPLSRYNSTPRCQACTAADRNAPDPPADTILNGPRLRELRRARGITLQLLADRASISPAAVSMLERNLRNRPTITTVTALAAALNVPPADLLTTTPPPAPETPTCPAPAPPGDFTAVLERHMQARRMSVRATARAAGYSDHTLLSKVLNGHRPINPYMAAKLDRALDANGEITAAAETALAEENARKANRQSAAATETIPATLPSGTGDAWASEPLTIHDPLRPSITGNMVNAVKRRELLLGMATTATLGAVGGMLPPFKHVDPELIPYFQQQLEGHYRADMLLGPRALIDTVTAQCNLIGQLINSADEPTRRHMAVVGTSFATFAAWLYLDAGDIAAALRWHDAAQELAHRSRDREAIACALVDRAMARTDQGTGAAVVDLCNGALMDAGHLSPELRVFALQQQAHGASLLGDRRQVDALLDEAGRLRDQVDVEVWGTACLRTPHYVEVQRATCYGRLGFASEALGVWQQIMPAAPSTARRDVGVWVARQATLSASLREPERTVALARHAVKVALETGSARVRRELAAAEVTMTPWQAEPVGQEFTEVLAPISGEI